MLQGLQVVQVATLRTAMSHFQMSHFSNVLPFDVVSPADLQPKEDISSRKVTVYGQRSRKGCFSPWGGF